MFERTLRAFSVLTRNGPREFVSKLVNKLRATLGFPSQQHEQFVRRKALLDESFDAERGLDTGGVQRLHELTIRSKNARYGTSHIASDPLEFAAAMDSVDIPMEGSTFIDLGSGKGRALSLALAYPFRHIIGVEFARELHLVARENIEHLRQTDESASRIELVCADACDYDLPDEPVVLFLFHPFDAPIMQAVARNALTSWRSIRRPLRVVYVNPRYLEQWTLTGWTVVDQQHYHAVLRPA